MEEITNEKKKPYLYLISNSFNLNQIIYLIHKIRGVILVTNLKNQPYQIILFVPPSFSLLVLQPLSSCA